MDVFCEQFDLLHSSGLYKRCNKFLIYVSLYEDNLILDRKLKEYDPDSKFLVFKTRDNLKEKFAFDDFRNHIEDEIYMFYFHSKSVSYQPTGEMYCQFQNKQNWRKVLDFYTIEKWRINLEFIEKYDAVGCFLTKMPVHHFAGNFWWAKINYVKNLPNCGDHYLSPEMFLGEHFNNNFISLTIEKREQFNFHSRMTDEDILKNITSTILINNMEKLHKNFTKKRTLQQKTINS